MSPLTSSREEGCQTRLQVWFRGAHHRRAQVKPECAWEAQPRQTEGGQPDDYVVVADATYADDEAIFLTFDSNNT